MDFHTSVRALLDTYGRCMAMLNVHGSSSAAHNTDGDAEALSRTLRADQDRVYRAYTSRLDETGSTLAQGDARAQSTLGCIVRRLRAVLVSLGGRKTPPPPPLPDYNALRTLSQVSCLEAIRAMDALSERLRSKNDREAAAAGTGAHSGSRKHAAWTGSRRADRSRGKEGEARGGEGARRAERTGQAGQGGKTGRESDGSAGTASNKRLPRLPGSTLAGTGAARPEPHGDESGKPQAKPEKQHKKVREQVGGFCGQEPRPNGRDPDEKRRNQREKDGDRVRKRKEEKERQRKEEKERQRKEEKERQRKEEEKEKERKKRERKRGETKQASSLPSSEPRLGLQLRPRERQQAKKRPAQPEKSRHGNNHDGLVQTRTRQQDGHVSLRSMSSGSTKIGEIPQYKWPALEYSVEPAYPVRPFQTAVSEKPKRRLWGCLKKEKGENGEGGEEWQNDWARG